MNNRRYMSLVLPISIFILLFAIVHISTHACAQDQNKTTTIKLNDGMEAEIDPVGRNNSGEVVTVALTLCNKGEKTFYLAHIGPARAQDNAGGVYTSLGQNGVSGVIDDYQWLIRSDQDKIARIQGFTRIDPKTNATINFTLNGKKSKGSLMSFSTVLVVRSVDNLIADKTLNENNKIKGLYLMNISFRSIPVNDAP